MMAIYQQGRLLRSSLHSTKLEHQLSYSHLLLTLPAKHYKPSKEHNRVAWMTEEEEHGRLIQAYREDCTRLIQREADVIV